MTEFTHRTYEAGQTIAAIATPPGEGGIAIIRISGKEAFAIADRIFSGPIHDFASHTAHFGKIQDLSGHTIDEGLALVMRAPRSYTGEDTVEFQCHGGTLIPQRVLEAALQAGARAAKPGEFTLKAFQNGKMDLTQAEAVQQLIAAKNSLALQAAENQLRGKLHHLVRDFQNRLTDCAAILEAWVDFPEEGLEFATYEEMGSVLSTILGEMQTLYATFHEGKKLETGLSICLLGAPNVGKSSLMNAFAGHERAIVTDVPGTTRDLLEEEILLGGLHFRLVDTAGVRQTDELVEQEGVKRSLATSRTSDLVLLVIDLSCPVYDPKWIKELPANHTLVIWNKVDLKPAAALPSFPFPSVQVSAKKGIGLEHLKYMIQSLVWKKGLPSKEEVIVTNQRHFESLRGAIQAIDELLRGLEEKRSPEFLAADIRIALKELGTIVGRNIGEDVLGAIFSKFCVGK